MDVHLYKFFSARRYIALIASVKFGISSLVQKRLGMYKFVRTKSHTESKFTKIFFERLYIGWIVVVHLYCESDHVTNWYIPYLVQKLRNSDWMLSSGEFNVHITQVYGARKWLLCPTARAGHKAMMRVWRLTSVCLRSVWRLSIAYRTERPRKTKIGSVA